MQKRSNRYSSPASMVRTPTLKSQVWKVESFLYRISNAMINLLLLSFCVSISLVCAGRLRKAYVWIAIDQPTTFSISTWKSSYHCTG
jgi:hypothetical protein